MLPASEVARGGMAGLAQLRFAVRDGRTRLTRSETRPPLLVQRALYLDECLPDLVFTYIANPTAGILANDHFRVDVHVESGARTHLTTPAATKVFAMPAGSASQETRLTVGPGGYLEYLPEPLIPFRGSRFQQSMTVRAASGATVIAGEILMSGRAAHGESLSFAALSSRLTVEDADGLPQYHEAFSLAPAEATAAGLGVFGRFTTPVIGTLLVITDAVPPAVVLAAIREGLEARPDAFAGATALPSGLGVGVKVLAGDTPPVRAQLRAAWGVARRLILGAGPPAQRKS